VASLRQPIQIRVEKGGPPLAIRCNQVLISLFLLLGTTDLEVSKWGTSLNTLETLREKPFLILRIMKGPLEGETLRPLTRLTPLCALGEIETLRSERTLD